MRSSLNILKEVQDLQRLQPWQLEDTAVTKNSSLSVEQREGEAKRFPVQAMHEYAG